MQRVAVHRARDPLSDGHRSMGAPALQRTANALRSVRGTRPGAIDTSPAPRLTARPSGEQPATRSREDAIMPTHHARSNPAANIFSRSILAGLALIGVSALFSP